MSITHCNPNDFIPNFLKLIRKERYKIVELSEFDFLNIKINSHKYKLTYNKNTQILLVKTGNKIRNPENFKLFINTFIETKLLINNKLAPGQIKIKEIHPYPDYVQDSKKILVNEPLESQQGEIITTQAPSLLPIFIRGYKVQSYDRIYKV